MWPWDRGEQACGAVGIGTWAVLSSIPEGACACGAEGRMASIGPPALGAKGCVERLRPTGETTHYILCVAPLLQNVFAVHRFAQGAADWRSGPRWSIISVLCPVHPFATTWHFPSRGNKEFEEKNRESYTSCTSPAIPLWWLAPPPFPRKRGALWVLSNGAMSLQESIETYSGTVKK